KKLFHLPPIKPFQHHQDLLQHFLIQNNQPIQTTQLHQPILHTITSSYPSLLSNHINNIIKTLTFFTLLFTLPTLLFTFFPINLPLPIHHHTYLSYIIVLG
ncbi:CorA family divalent cation transporter, partial [Staphylococcus epidermidis]|uniref:CorA family divalent cation transporter n=1 Tax=Staphylococcus epidermidis TaxID=1282 RepID=UPI0028CB37ED